MSKRAMVLLQGKLFLAILVVFSQNIFSEENLSSAAIISYTGKEAKKTCIASLGKHSPICKYKNIQVFFDTSDITTIRYLIKNKKYGLYDYQGKEIISPLYDSIGFESTKTYKIKSKNKYGILDSSGNIIIPDIYNAIQTNDLGYIVKLNGKYGLYDKYTQKVPCNYDSIFYNSEDSGWFLVQQGKTFGAYTYDWKEIPCKYESVQYIKNWFKVKMNGKYGAYSQERESVPCEYDDIQKLETGYKVQSNGKNGVYLNNHLIIPCEYDDISKDKAYFRCFMEDGESFFDETGKRINTIHYGSTLLGKWFSEISEEKETVHIKGDKVQYRSRDKKSGTLQLSLFFFKEKYSGGAIHGYEIAHSAYSPLEANKSYLNIDETLTFDDVPPSGTYYETLFLSEYSEGHNTIQDYVNFSSPIFFDAGELGRKISLVGGWHYQIDYGQNALHVWGDTIRYETHGGHSGSLKLSLFFLHQEYDGGEINGYEVFSCVLDPLSANYSYYNINRTRNFKAIPPSGTYYATLVLSEYSDDHYKFKDYTNFDNTIYFDGNSMNNNGNEPNTGDKIEAVLQALQAMTNTAATITNAYSGESNSYGATGYTNESTTNPYIEKQKRLNDREVTSIKQHEKNMADEYMRRYHEELAEAESYMRQFRISGDTEDLRKSTEASDRAAKYLKSAQNWGN